MDNNKGSKQDIGKDQKQKKESFFEKIKEQVEQQIQRQTTFGQDIQKDAIVLLQHRQNKYPFSNSVILRIQTNKRKGFSSLGSGVIVTINQKKYIATVCHNFYYQPNWFQVIAFLKKERLKNSVRKQITIYKQQLKYNLKFLQKMQPQYEIAFVEIQTYDFIKKNKALQIHFDWDINSQDQVYFMAFPYEQNSRKIQINDFQSSSILNLLFRKIKVQKQEDMFIYYKNPTEKGESGGALMIQKNGIFKLIGLHIGAKLKKNQKRKDQCQKKQQQNPQNSQNGYNFGILFQKQKLNQTFQQIFQGKNHQSENSSSDSDSDEEKKNNKNIQRMSKMRLTQNSESSQTIIRQTAFYLQAQQLYKTYSYQNMQSRGQNERVFNPSCGESTKQYLHQKNKYQSGNRWGACGCRKDHARFFLCKQCYYDPKKLDLTKEKDVLLLNPDQQNTYPFSNSVIIRSKREKAKQYSLGSGVIVNYQNKIYILTMCHILYQCPQWFKVKAFLKQQNKINKQRIQVQINKQSVIHNKNYPIKGKIKDEIALIEIQNLNFIENNQTLEIIFDWNYKNGEQLYVMAFPYKLNNQMVQIQNSQRLILSFRKMKVYKQENNLIYYQNPTEQGEIGSGGALMIDKNGKFYLIGLHIGGYQDYENANQNTKCLQNIGILFNSNQMKNIFSDIFLKRSKPVNNSQDNNKSIELVNQGVKKIRITQDYYGIQNSKRIPSFFQNFQQVVSQGYAFYQDIKGRNSNERVFSTDMSCGSDTNYYVHGNSYQPGIRWGKCGFRKDHARVYLCNNCHQK